MQQHRWNEGWEHYPGNLGGVWEVWRGDKLNNHFNVPWQQVTLPHCFNSHDAVDPDVTYYQGQGWYRNRLALRNPYPGGRTLLHFEGAGQNAKVFVHTKEVGAHKGGYDEFTIDITDAANGLLANPPLPDYRDAVPLAVLCDNSRDLQTIPSDISDFNLYGGLYRYLNVQYVPLISVQRVHIDVQAASRDKASGKISVRLYNPQSADDEVALDVTVQGPSGEFVMREKLTINSMQVGNYAEISLEIDQPALWSTQYPQSYDCSVRLASKHGETEVKERFGVRFFEFAERGPFYLNGERLLLQGTHRHEDFAGVGAAMTESLMRQEMQLMKDMGVNFIRLGHYQQSRIILDLCDELGILVWEEIPWCRGGIGDEAYRQQCRDMLAAMIDQHRHHPSVVLWGLGNENDWEADFETFDEEEIRNFMQELHDLSHRLDPSRMTAIRRCEFCKDIVDVYSPSIWAGWYRGTYPEYETYAKAGFEGVKRFLHVEWGADNLAGRHAEKPYTGFDVVAAGQGADERDGDYFLNGGDPRVSSLGDWSETYFCDMIDWYLRCQSDMPWLTGTAQWAFKDFSTPVRPDSPVPYMNLKGIVQRDLTPKEAYYVFQSYWTDKPMVRLYGHDWKVRWGEADELKTVKVYSNGDWAELWVNGESCGRKQRNIRDFPCAGLRWETVFREGVNELKVAAEKDGVIVTDTLRFVYQTEIWEEPAQLRISAERQEDGKHRIEVAAYDRQGVFCPDARNFVRFSLAGDGKLLHNLGTVRGSRLVQLAGGRASIEAETGSGGATVGVSSEGMSSVFATLRI